MEEKWRKDRREPRLVWREAEETMTLEGEAVLTFHLIWPELEGAGLGGDHRGEALAIRAAVVLNDQRSEGGVRV